MVDNFEADIEEWYFNHQDEIPLPKFLCSQRALKGSDDSCLDEDLPNRKGDTASAEKAPKKKSKDEL